MSAPRRSYPAMSKITRATLAVAIVIAAIAYGGTTHADTWSVVPNPKLTPGETRPLTLDQICSTKWGKDARAVTSAMKEHVFRAYGVPYEARHSSNGKVAFEVDHLISRELGGADTERNLWPEPYFGQWNAHMKDRVENRLHAEVCAKRLTLDAAQQMIRTDWRAAYVQYFGTVKQLRYN